MSNNLQPGKIYEIIGPYYLIKNGVAVGHNSLSILSDPFLGHNKNYVREIAEVSIAWFENIYGHLLFFVGPEILFQVPLVRTSSFSAASTPRFSKTIHSNTTETFYKFLSNEKFVFTTTQIIPFLEEIATPEYRE